MLRKPDESAGHALGYEARGKITEDEFASIESSRRRYRATARKVRRFDASRYEEAWRWLREPNG